MVGHNSAQPEKRLPQFEFFVLIFVVWVCVGQAIVKGETGAYPSVSDVSRSWLIIIETTTCSGFMMPYISSKWVDGDSIIKRYQHNISSLSQLQFSLELAQLLRGERERWSDVLS